MIAIPAHETPISMPTLAPVLRPDGQFDSCEQFVDEGCLDVVMVGDMVLDDLEVVVGDRGGFGAAEDLDDEEVEELETAFNLSGDNSSNVSLLGLKQFLPGPQQAHKLAVWLYTMSGAPLSATVWDVVSIPLGCGSCSWDADLLQRDEQMGSS